MKTFIQVGKKWYFIQKYGNAFRVCVTDDLDSKKFKVANTGSFLNCSAFLDEVIFTHKKEEV